MFWSDFRYQFLSLTHPLNAKRHTLIFTFTYTSFLVEDSLHCIPEIAENTCQSSQLEMCTKCTTMVDGQDRPKDINE